MFYPSTVLPMSWSFMDTKEISMGFRLALDNSRRERERETERERERVADSIARTKERKKERERERDRDIHIYIYVYIYIDILVLMGEILLTTMFLLHLTKSSTILV